MFPPHELALADFARHLSLLLASAPPVPTLDTLQRLVGFGLDPLKVEGGQPIQIGGDRVLEIGEAGQLTCHSIGGRAVALGSGWGGRLWRPYWGEQPATP